MEEYQKNKQQSAGTATVESGMDDERAHRLLQEERRRHKEQEALQLAASTLNPSKRQDMQRQKQLQTQMQIAFQTGDKATYRRLKAKLEADE